MQKPKVDDDLTLLTDFGKTEAICIDVLDNPATEEGSFTQGDGPRPIRTRSASLDTLIATDQKSAQLWRTFSKQTIDSEVTLSTVLPA